MESHTILPPIPYTISHIQKVDHPYLCMGSSLVLQRYTSELFMKLLNTSCSTRNTTLPSRVLLPRARESRHIHTRPHSLPPSKKKKRSPLGAWIRGGAFRWVPTHRNNPPQYTLSTPPSSSRSPPSHFSHPSPRAPIPFPPSTPSHSNPACSPSGSTGRNRSRHTRKTARGSV